MSDENKQQTKVSPEKEKVEIKENSVKIDPYKVFGRDFSLTDPDYITYYKTKLKMMAIQYKLVGRVNAKGEYSIPAAVKKDLINMFKEIEDMDDDWYKASAVYMKLYYYFDVKLTLDGDKAKASLYLSEYVGDCLEEEYIVSHIADFTSDFDEEFRIKVRKAFNLVDVAVPMSDVQVPSLAVVRQDAFDLELLIGGLYDIASQIYIMRMLKALESAGEEGKIIIKRYKELSANKDEILTDAHANTRLKALLDRAIDENGGLEKLGRKYPPIKGVVLEMNSSIKSIDNIQKRPAGVEILKTEQVANKIAGNKVLKKEQKKDGKKAPAATKPAAPKATKSSSSTTTARSWLDELSRPDIKSDDSKGSTKSNNDKGSIFNELPEEEKPVEEPIPNKEDPTPIIYDDENDGINLDEDDGMAVTSIDENQDDLNLDEDQISESDTTVVAVEINMTEVETDGMVADVNIMHVEYVNDAAQAVKVDDTINLEDPAKAIEADDLTLD